MPQHIPFYPNLDGDILRGQFPPLPHFHPQVCHEFDLPHHCLVRESVLGDFGATQPPHKPLLLEHSDVSVPQAGKEGGTRDRSGTATCDKKDLLE